MQTNISIPKDVQEYLNTLPEPIKLNRKQQWRVRNYLRKHSTPLPLLGARWKLPFKLAEMIAKEGKDGLWLDIDALIHIADRNELKHLGDEIGYYSLADILEAAFRVEDSIVCGPYHFCRQKRENTRTLDPHLDWEYFVQVNDAELEKYNAMLAEIRLQQPSEADAAKQP